MNLKNRITEIKQMRVGDLLDNEGNWRTHPEFQQDVVRGTLEGVGKADVLKAYYSERQGGLTLIDGHLRKALDPEELWHVAVLDVTDDEADLLLATYDSSAALAGMDADKVMHLTETVVTDDLAVRDLLRKMDEQAKALLNVVEEEEQDKAGAAEGGPPEMDLQPFEHYDYVVLFFRTSFDYERAIDVFGIQREGFTIRDSQDYSRISGRKVGMGRVIDGAKALDILGGLKDAPH